jgi:F-type H+-transporting ATPase subunit b
MNINLTMIGQLMMFAMFTWFCMKFVWPPIVAAMEERKKRIESGLIAAERGLSLHFLSPIVFVTSSLACFGAL